MSPASSAQHQDYFVAAESVKHFSSMFTQASTRLLLQSSEYLVENWHKLWKKTCWCQ